MRRHHTQILYSSSTVHLSFPITTSSHFPFPSHISLAPKILIPCISFGHQKIGKSTRQARRSSQRITNTSQCIFQLLHRVQNSSSQSLEEPSDTSYVFWTASTSHLSSKHPFDSPTLLSRSSTAPTRSRFTITFCRNWWLYILNITSFQRVRSHTRLAERTTTLLVSWHETFVG